MSPKLVIIAILDQGYLQTKRYLSRKILENVTSFTVQDAHGLSEVMSLQIKENFSNGNS